MALHEHHKQIVCLFFTHIEILISCSYFLHPWACSLRIENASALSSMTSEPRKTMRDFCNLYLHKQLLKNGNDLDELSIRQVCQTCKMKSAFCLQYTCHNRKKILNLLKKTQTANCVRVWKRDKRFAHTDVCIKCQGYLKRWILQSNADAFCRTIDFVK